jgi:hypothetical protein
LRVLGRSGVTRQVINRAKRDDQVIVRQHVFAPIKRAACGYRSRGEINPLDLRIVKLRRRKDSASGAGDLTGLHLGAKHFVNEPMKHREIITVDERCFDQATADGRAKVLSNANGAMTPAQAYDARRHAPSDQNDVDLSYWFIRR